MRNYFPCCELVLQLSNIHPMDVDTVLDGERGGVARNHDPLRRKQRAVRDFLGIAGRAQ